MIKKPLQGLLPLPRLANQSLGGVWCLQNVPQIKVLTNQRADQTVLANAASRPGVLGRDGERVGGCWGAAGSELGAPRPIGSRRRRLMGRAAPRQPAVGMETQPVCRLREIQPQITRAA